MSYVKSIEVVFKQMEYHGIRYWQIFDQNKLDIIAESSDDETLMVTDSIEHMREVTSDLNGLIYVVIRKDGAPAKRKAISGTQGSANVDSGRGIYKFQVIMGEAADKANNPGMGGMGSNITFKLMQDNFNLQISHMQEKAELERKWDERIKNLEEKLSKNSDDPISKEYAKKGLEMLDRLLTKEKKKE